MHVRRHHRKSSHCGKAPIVKTSKFVCHFSVLTALLLSPMPVVAQTPLADFVGTYADGPKHKVEIAIDAKGQLVAVVDDAAYPLKITGQDELTNNGGEKIPFKRDVQGRVSGYFDHVEFHRKLSGSVSPETSAEITAPARPRGEIYRYRTPVARHDGIVVGDIAQTPLGVATAEQIVAK